MSGARNGNDITRYAAVVSVEPSDGERSSSAQSRCDERSEDLVVLPNRKSVRFVLGGHLVIIGFFIWRSLLQVFSLGDLSLREDLERLTIPAWLTGQDAIGQRS